MLNTNKPHWQNILHTYGKDYVLFTSFDKQFHHCKTFTQVLLQGIHNIRENLQDEEYF